MMTPVKKTVAIRPVEFYGNGLPRPRFFDTPKFNSHRVDPPLSVLDPLLSWAREAHWSMGAPVAVKRRRYIDLNDDDEEEEEICLASIRRKLSDDFDRVAGESNSKANKNPIESKSIVKDKKKKTESSSTRSSPRLAKRCSS
ncbi:hypothetical protein DY000_02038725 [Brassica cretica]|uniref:Uncharacterized protein n=1 Tax=Brassica cretica TaxID=69181 RepID=A0ABQ7BGK7_BRACR|nr:hypothetical protein DY000_02038725 [Brassica cretica]